MREKYSPGPVVLRVEGLRVLRQAMEIERWQLGPYDISIRLESLIRTALTTFFLRH